jgi:hypothetical protein
MDLFFTQRFEVDEGALENYGAFNISLASDIPLFIDPFLLFNSKKPAYKELHEEIIRYLVFLRQKAQGVADTGAIRYLFQFPEVKQNWLGYCYMGNEGRGLGKDFGNDLFSSLSQVLSNFGTETITVGSHLEKMALLRPGVGKDSISDFCTNLIKHFVLAYTEEFAKTNIDPKHRKIHRVAHVRFNYETESWESHEYDLPTTSNDYVILTPFDMLTKDDAWINHKDMLERFTRVVESVTNDELRSNLNSYFNRRIAEEEASTKKQATKDQKIKVVLEAIAKHPEFIDWYIRMKEQDGDRASSVAAEKVTDTKAVLVDLVTKVVLQLGAKSEFYKTPYSSLAECRARVEAFKYYVEHQDGYQLINNKSIEKDVQLFFGLIWFNSAFDVNREPNNGRGPVDFKVSLGSADKSLIEFKMASSSQLKRNLEKQVEIYEKANKTNQSIKVIIVRTQDEQTKVQKVLKDLDLLGNDAVVVIDARSDNKPSASKA